MITSARLFALAFLLGSESLHDRALRRFEEERATEPLPPLFDEEGNPVFL